jgi:signal transduction histidine kinase
LKYINNPEGEVFMVKTAKFVRGLGEGLLPWILLFFIGFATFSYFVRMPYVGVLIDNRRTVSSVYGPDQGENSFKKGDLIVQVGEVSYEETQKDLTRGYFQNARPGDLIPVVVERQGQPKNLNYKIPDITLEEIVGGRLSSQWFTPYIFWLAGTVVLLFLRPRSQTRTVLSLFCYITALWLAASTLSGYNFGIWGLFLRAMIWLSLPVYWHLHWLFPAPLKPLPGWAWGGVYGLAAVLALLSWLQFLPSNLYLLGFLLALAGSLALLGVHLATQPAERKTLSGLVVALGLVLTPVIAVLLIFILKIPFTFGAVVVLGLAALPGFYFFSLYRRQMRPERANQADRLVRGYWLVILIAVVFSALLAALSQTPLVFQYIPLLNRLSSLIVLLIALVNFLPFLVLPALADEHLTFTLGANRLSFSANRAAGGVLFVLLEALAVLLLAGLLYLGNFPGVAEFSLVLGVLVMGGGSLAFYRPFQRYFEEKVLGMAHAPETLAKTYAGRISTSLEAGALQSLLLDEVLPSLLVRRFAQLGLDGDKLVVEFGLRCEPQDLPGAGSLPALAAHCGRVLEPGEAAGLPEWVRLILPLQVNNERRGFWLLGQRDPDDYYSEEDISTLQALADQTALARVNIRQADDLRALYFADIDRAEVERLHLAAELHDDVLAQMAILNQNLPDEAPAALEAYDLAVARIREIINGLRPALLNFGLGTALRGLADELNDRHPEGPQVLVELEAASQRYEPRVELYLFRVAQQACQNAIQHANCRTIRVSGRLEAEAVRLEVHDDGKGFPAGETINLPSLLAGKHFGLAGMFERAALIGARLNIESTPGQGAKVSLAWDKK